ncbi:MAG: SDR family NAD(P)-dependent oxidoreductase [Pseudomonadota bacterium]
MTGDLKAFKRRHTPREPARSALITGATGGIGEAFAHALAPTTNLVLTGRDEEKLSNLSRVFEGGVTTVVADLSTEAGQNAVAAAAETAGCDLLINNAGLGAYGNFLDVPLTDQRATVHVDVEAVIALIHKIVPGMLNRAELMDTRAGLINVASSMAFYPLPTMATYAASKAFILSFTESLAAELTDRPIDVLAACPGAVKTPFGSRAGYAGGEIPGAMAPEKVASSSLAALGRQTTVVIGPVSAAAFAPVAMARSLFGQAALQATRLAQKVSDRV